MRSSVWSSGLAAARRTSVAATEIRALVRGHALQPGARGVGIAVQGVRLLAGQLVEDLLAALHVLVEDVARAERGRRVDRDVGPRPAAVARQDREELATRRRRAAVGEEAHAQDQILLRQDRLEVVRARGVGGGRERVFGGIREEVAGRVEHLDLRVGQQRLFGRRGLQQAKLGLAHEAAAVVGDDARAMVGEQAARVVGDHPATVVAQQLDLADERGRDAALVDHAGGLREPGDRRRVGADVQLDHRLAWRPGPHGRALATQRQAGGHEHGKRVREPTHRPLRGVLYPTLGQVMTMLLRWMASS